MSVNEFIVLVEMIIYMGKTKTLNIAQVFGEAVNYVSSNNCMMNDIFSSTFCHHPFYSVGQGPTMLSHMIQKYAVLIAEELRLVSDFID